MNDLSWLWPGLVLVSGCLVDNPDYRCHVGHVANHLNFAEQVTLPAGTNPNRVATGDFDHDGHIDIAVTNYLYVRESGGPATIRVFYGAGDGTFMPGVPVVVGDAPWSFVVADINRDQIDDMVMANYGAARVTAIFGDKNRSLRKEELHVGMQVGSAYCAKSDMGMEIKVPCAPLSVAMADLDRDQNLDLVVAYGDFTGVDVFLGSGIWTFRSPSRYDSRMGAGTPTLKIGDLDGDGILDVMLAMDNGIVGTFLGKGDGSFNEPLMKTDQLASGWSPSALGLLDFDDDKKVDVAVIASKGKSSDKNVALLSSPATNRTWSYSLSGGLNTWGLTTTDFNCDGNVDLAFVNQDSNSVTVRLGVGAGEFGEPASLMVGTKPLGIAAGDFNGDSLPDLVAANFDNGNVGVLINTSR